jgi:hypothetical protein
MSVVKGIISGTTNDSGGCFSNKYCRGHSKKKYSTVETCVEVEWFDYFTLK